MSRKRFPFIANAALFLMILLIQLLAPIPAVHAASSIITVNYGSDLPYGTDGAGGTVSYSPDTFDSIESGDATRVPANNSVSFYILADSGYRINEVWLHNGSDYTPYRSSLVADSGGWYRFTFNSQDKDWILYVDFAPVVPSYTVICSVVVPTCSPGTPECSNGSNGSINGTDAASLPKASNVAPGGSVSYTIAPATEYQIHDVETSTNDGASWTSHGAISYYTFFNVQSNSRIRASFLPRGYTITAKAGEHGALSPGGKGPVTSQVSVQKNTDQSFSIIPDSGYRILNVTVSDPAVGPNPLQLGAVSTYTFRNVTANGSISATFAPIDAAIDNYSQLPPFAATSRALLPNVLFILDNSGSMHDPAYTSAPYSATIVYYGYFDSAGMYRKDGTAYSPDTRALDLSDPLSGNKLNYENMTKIDLIRAALIGGKLSGRGSAAMSFLLDNGSTALLPAGAAEPTGVLHSLVGKVNFGLMFFNQGDQYESGANLDGGYLAAPLASDAAALQRVVDLVQQTNPSTWTPLAETLYEAVRYFRHAPSAYNPGIDYSSLADPVGYPCRKNAVIILTDGKPTKDQNIPGTAFTYGRTPVTDPSMSLDGTGIREWMGRIAANEKSSDRWNTPLDDAGSSYLEGVAYWAHNTDLRSDLPGTQNLSVYVVYAFGGDAAAREVLQLTAKYGAYDDKNGNGVPDGGTGSLEWNRRGDGVPDTYFEAGGGDLGNAIMSAIHSVFARVSLGSAVSPVGTGDGNGAVLMQATFYPEKAFEKETEAFWTGELQGFWYYVDPFMSGSSAREDTDYYQSCRAPADIPNVADADHLLDLKQDLAVNFRFDGARSVADLGRDSKGKGLADTVVATGLDPDQVHSIWRAGKRLWGRTDPRNVYLPCLPGASCSNGLFPFTDAAKTLLRPYLQAADDTEAAKIINYILGVDQSGYRSRKVTLLTGPGEYASHVWKLGDMISSVPKIQSSRRQNAYSLTAPQGYGDKSYGYGSGTSRSAGYINTAPYRGRGMVYVGANDGMLHAFKMGELKTAVSGTVRAKLSGTGLGDEVWAFIPKHALPYLKYLGDKNYGDKHVYYLDSTPTIVDASIGSCSEADYWNCPADEAGGTNWRTVLIGGMGTGGATRAPSSPACSDCVFTPATDPADPDNLRGLGYSSYYALDITDPTTPVFLWEFSNPALGYTTSGPAIIRLSATDRDGNPIPKRNGRWFAVFVSGPTGALVSSEFRGNCDQRLTVFIVDLKSGALAATIDTLSDGSTLEHAFGGAVTTGSVDTDRWNSSLPGFYQDDGVYIGYSQRLDRGWNGGVLRLLNNERLDATGAAAWRLSRVIDGTGPVTTNVARLQDRKNHNLWLFFGTGRYFYASDDPAGQQGLYAVKEPCYGFGTGTTRDKLDFTCTAAASVTDLTRQNGPVNPVSNRGWYVALRPRDPSNGWNAERAVTDPRALINGAVFFTTFQPTADPCGFGGDTTEWVFRYDSGAPPPCFALQGKMLIQVSTGNLEQVDLSRTFSCVESNGALRSPAAGAPPVPAPSGWDPPVSTPYRLAGKPPPQPPPILSNAGLVPVKRIIHLQER